MQLEYNELVTIVNVLNTVEVKGLENAAALLNLANKVQQMAVERQREVEMEELSQEGPNVAPPSSVPVDNVKSIQGKKGK